MGNFHSAHIDCLVEKQIDLKPGEKLRGVVKLTVVNQERFHENFRGISIVVAGVEYMIAPRVVSGEKYEKEKACNVVLPTSKVVKIKSTIDFCGGSKNNVLTKGDHEFPFEIELPTTIHQDHNMKKKGNRLRSTSETMPLALPIEIQSLESSDSSISTLDSEESTQPASSHTTNDDSMGESCRRAPRATIIEGFEPERRRVVGTAKKTMFYDVKASLRRRKNVPLSVDTDIKCRGRCPIIMHHEV